MSLLRRGDMFNHGRPADDIHVLAYLYVRSSVQSLQAWPGHVGGGCPLTLQSRRRHQIENSASAALHGFTRTRYQGRIVVTAASQPAVGRPVGASAGTGPPSSRWHSCSIPRSCRGWRRAWHVGKPAGGEPFLRESRGVAPGGTRRGTPRAGPRRVRTGLGAARECLASAIDLLPTGVRAIYPVCYVGCGSGSTKAKCHVGGCPSRAAPAPREGMLDEGVRIRRTYL